jgi:ABC-2 type transport system ATP-binding protein
MLLLEYERGQAFSTKIYTIQVLTKLLETVPRYAIIQKVCSIGGSIMIQVEQLTKEFVSTKKYPGFKGAIKGLFTTEKIRKTAVDNISFHISKGEMVGYIGSNGAGKSTSIKMMTGIVTPTSGRCVVNGIIPYENREENASNIGVVFGQRTQLWWDLPLSETFTVLKEIYNVSDTDFTERMDYLNGVLELDEFIHNTVRTLSLGQRMRADLAAALLHNPKVLYLDEPTIGLDLVVKESIRKAIRQINEQYETTVILTTHDLGDIEELCKRILIIDEGKLIYDGTIEAIKDTYGTTRKVSIEAKDIEPFRKVNYNQRFSLPEEVFSVKIDNNSVVYTFDKNRINVSDIISDAMSTGVVGDIKIQETEIGEIVKEIYRHGV